MEYCLNALARAPNCYLNISDTLTKQVFRTAVVNLLTLLVPRQNASRVSFSKRQYSENVYLN